MDIYSELEQLKKRVELLENIVLQSQQQAKTENTSTSGRDKTRYMFENKIYAKNRFVLAVVEKYVSEHSPTLDELRGVFDKSLQGSLNVVETVENANKIKDAGKRYFMQNPLTLSDGQNIVVCTQWGIFNIAKFEKLASQLGYKFDKV